MAILDKSSAGPKFIWRFEPKTGILGHLQVHFICKKAPISRGFCEIQNPTWNPRFLERSWKKCQDRSKIDGLGQNRPIWHFRIFWVRPRALFTFWFLKVDFFKNCENGDFVWKTPNEIRKLEKVARPDKNVEFWNLRGFKNEKVEIFENRAIFEKWVWPDRSENRCFQMSDFVVLDRAREKVEKLKKGSKRADFWKTVFSVFRACRDLATKMPSFF